jgi:general secretion pathway protein M
MTPPALSLPEGPAGQALAVALALLAALLLWFGLMTPLFGWYASQSDALAAAQLEAAHLQALRDSLPALRRQIAADAARQAGADILLAGDSDAIAGANLQASLNNLAADAGTSLDSAEMVAAQQTGALRRIGVAVSLSATWPVLVAYLAAIEAASPRMIVDDLSVSADSTPDNSQDVTLQASFTVSAVRAGTAP